MIYRVYQHYRQAVAVNAVNNKMASKSHYRDLPPYYCIYGNRGNAVNRFSVKKRGVYG